MASLSVDTKRIALILSFLAGALGIAGVFVWAGLGALAAAAAMVAAGIFMMNFTLYAIGSAITSRVTVPRWMRRICAALLVIGNVFFSVAGLVYAAQDKMLFYNVTGNESREVLRKLAGYSEVTFSAANGKTYHGMLYRAQTKEPSPLVIYFGGNGECSYDHLRKRAEQGDWQYFAGYSYLSVDYEGYGLNDGQPSCQNMYAEALAVYDYVASLSFTDSGRIAVMGYSLGTGSAVYLAANRPIAGLVLLAPYANGYDLYNNMLPIFQGPMKLLVKHKLASDEYAASVAAPALIFASRADESVPFASSERLSRNFAGRVEFVPVEGVSHNEIWGVESVKTKIKDFLEEGAQ